MGTLTRLLEAHAAVHETQAARDDAAAERRRAVLELRDTGHWDREGIAAILQIDPRSLDRLVREARSEQREVRG